MLQRAVAMVLEAIYEQSFLDCSYGFRPGRSAHQALRLVQSQTVKMAGRWVLEIDIRKFFDTLDHRQLRDIVRKRVRDGVLLRLIGKWLNAGVMEDGAIEYPEAGTPQGGVISPLLANIYLHEVLDEWFVRQVAPRLVGRAVLVRYADDVVIIFGNEQDARRVFDVLPKRFAKYGLTLHPEKTRLVDFRRPDRRALPSPDNGDVRSRPGTFDLLGFTHYWAKSRKGYWVVKQKTAADRLRRALKRIADWCRAIGTNRSLRLRSGGCASASAWRTIRRCTPSLRAIPFIVPPPNSYSLRICSNSSTFALLFIPSLLPHLQDAPVKWGWANLPHRSGPFHSIEITHDNVLCQSKSPTGIGRPSGEGVG